MLDMAAGGSAALRPARREGKGGGDVGGLRPPVLPSTRRCRGSGFRSPRYAQPGRGGVARARGTAGHGAGTGTRSAQPWVPSGL